MLSLWGLNLGTIRIFFPITLAQFSSENSIKILISGKIGTIDTFPSIFPVLMVLCLFPYPTLGHHIPRLVMLSYKTLTLNCWLYVFFLDTLSTVTGPQFPNWGEMEKILFRMGLSN